MLVLFSPREDLYCHLNHVFRRAEELALVFTSAPLSYLCGGAASLYIVEHGRT